MRCPFPGMDPYLEHPALWPDFHDSLIAGMRDALAPLVAPRYYVALERRTYLLKPDDMVFIGRLDVAVIPSPGAAAAEARPTAGTGVLEVEVPLNDEVGETFLEVRDVRNRAAVTILDVLSPVNKLHPRGRETYEVKRGQVFQTRTSLVEVDLLRDGLPMPVVGKPLRADYRILVSRGALRPRAQLYAFTVRQPIPSFPLPLLPGDSEPTVDLGGVLHALCGRARFDLRVDYSGPPTPPLDEDDAAWAQGLLGAAGA